MKTEKIIIKTTPADRAASWCRNEVRSGSLDVRIIMTMGNGTVRNRICFYRESQTPDNAIGFCGINGNASEQAITEVIRLGLNYAVRITGCEGKDFTADVDFEEPEETDNHPGSESPEVTAAADRAVSTGLFTGDDISLRLRYMNDSHFTSRMKARVLEYLSGTPYARQPEPKTFYVNPDGDDRETNLSGVVQHMLCGTAPILQGDKSVGKNVCLDTAAWLLNEPIAVWDMNDELTSEDAYGYKTTDNTWSEKITPEMAEAYMCFQADPIGNMGCLKPASVYEFLKTKSASVSIVHKVSVFLEKYQNGGILVANEMDMASANYLQRIFHSVLDNRGYIDIPGFGRAVKHPRFILAGTCNAGYAGSNEMNEATMSRFAVVRFRYPKSIEKQLRAAVHTDAVPDTAFRQIDRYYMSLKEAVEKHVNGISSKGMNIRGFVRSLDTYAWDSGARSLRTIVRENTVYAIQDERERSNMETLLRANITL